MCDAAACLGDVGVDLFEFPREAGALVAKVLEVDFCDALLVGGVALPLALADLGQVADQRSDWRVPLAPQRPSAFPSPRPLLPAA